MKVSTPFAHWVPKQIAANMRWRSAVHKRVLDDPSYAQVIIDACSRDPLFFLNGFAWTSDPRREPFSKLPFILYDFQEQAILDLIESFNDHDKLVEKSRDMGASWICVSSAFWAWRFRPSLSFLFGSRTENYVDDAGNPKSLFWKIDFIRKNLPAWLQPRGYSETQHRRKMHIENPENESVIDGESTTGQFARGDRRTGIFLDEFGAVEQGHRILSSTRDATNCRIFNSTPNGTNNAFYDVRQTGIEKIRLHWSAHPIKAQGLYRTDDDGKLKILDPAGYPDGYEPTLDNKLRSPWYDGECKRCVSEQEIAQELDIDYLGSGFQYFNEPAIREAIRNYARPAICVGDLEHDDKTAEPIRYRDESGGSLELWCLLGRGDKPPTEHRHVIGCDISAGTGASNSCASIYDAVTCEKVGQFSSPYIRPEAFAKQAVALAQWFGDALLIWESNGPGRQFGSRVMELGYGNVYLRQRDEAISKKVTDIPGWAATRETKSVLLGNYRAAVEKGECINRSKEALEETLEYVFTPDGGIAHACSVNKDDPSGAKANHGDRVTADALAWKGLTERQGRPEPKQPKVLHGSLAWRRERRGLEKKDRDRDGWD